MNKNSVRKIQFPLKYLIYGKGRMSLALVDFIQSNRDKFSISDVIGKEDKLDSVKDSDIIIDFSHPEGTMSILESCIKFNKVLVIGTTGHTNTMKERIERASHKIPVFFAANFSIGIALMSWLIDAISQKVAAISSISSNINYEIIESHHNLKKDSPSGTALHLLKILQNNMKDSSVIYGRHGDCLDRPPNEIGIHSIRSGHIIGEHTMLLSLLNERLEIKHIADNRSTFASGAVCAGLWTYENCSHGLFNMQDYLQIT